MFWIVLAVVWAVVWVAASCWIDEDLLPMSLFSLVVLILIGQGITAMPCLVGKQEMALSLKSEIETVRSAYYEYVGVGGAVAGSLDNLSQSGALSDYIKSFARAKADYNSKLLIAKIKKTDSTLWWFSNGAFISSGVLDMELIK